MIRSCSMIFATAFGYQPFTQQVAKENPDKYFFGITPTVAPAANILNYYGKLWDGRYLTGIVAGKMTKSNKIGFVAAQPIPTVIAGINAFTLGVRSVNPQAKVEVVWTLSWYDPAAEKQAAVALVEGGADVIAQHQDTPSPIQGAAAKGAWAIGSESDMRAPDTVPTLHFGRLSQLPFFGRALLQQDAMRMTPALTSRSLSPAMREGPVEFRSAMAGSLVYGGRRARPLILRPRPHSCRRSSRRPGRNRQARRPIWGSASQDMYARAPRAYSWLQDR